MSDLFGSALVLANFEAGDVPAIVVPIDVNEWAVNFGMLNEVLKIGTRSEACFAYEMYYFAHVRLLPHSFCCLELS